MEDYTAKELNVEKDEMVEGKKELNGWLWCVKSKDGDEGWLPKKVLVSIPPSRKKAGDAGI